MLVEWPHQFPQKLQHHFNTFKISSLFLQSLKMILKWCQLWQLIYIHMFFKPNCQIVTGMDFAWKKYVGRPNWPKTQQRTCRNWSATCDQCSTFMRANKSKKTSINVTSIGYATRWSEFPYCFTLSEWNWCFIPHGCINQWSWFSVMITKL